VKIYPFQIAAANFALHSPFLKGAILADEGSLGKTIEALLVISQMWYEGREKILLVVPTTLSVQWEKILERHFSLPYAVLEENSDLNQNCVFLTTYDFVYANLEKISEIPWDVVAFDEAHRLSKCYEENRSAKLKKSSRKRL
jgi:SNF2 family DNA or RNA helicase